MSRYSTSPDLFDEALQINLTKLRDLGLLEPGEVKSDKLKWSLNGEEVSSISIKTNTKSDNYYVELDYKYQGEPRTYEVPIVKVKSNLGKGSLLYFLCPNTAKRCRILYCIDGYFLHRDAFQGCFYEKQLHSKSWRQMEKLYGNEFLIDEYYEQLHAKHFKKTYARKPTKKYVKILKKIEELENSHHNYTTPVIRL